MSPKLLDSSIEEKEEFLAVTQAARKDYGILESSFENKYCGSSFSVIFLHFLPGNEFLLKRSIEVILEKGKEGGYFIVSNLIFNKYGLGETKEQALNALIDNILDDYDFLRTSSPGKLTEDAKDQLKLYREFIKE